MADQYIENKFLNATESLAEKMPQMRFETVTPEVSFYRRSFTMKPGAVINISIDEAVPEETVCTITEK